MICWKKRKLLWPHKALADIHPDLKTPSERISNLIPFWSPRTIFALSSFCLKREGVGCDIAISVCSSRPGSLPTRRCTCTWQRWNHSQGLQGHFPTLEAVIQSDNSTTPSTCLSAPQTPAVLSTFFEKCPALNPGGSELAASQFVFSGTLEMLNIIVSLLSWNYNLHKHKRQNPHLKKKCFRRF